MACRASKIENFRKNAVGIGANGRFHRQFDGNAAFSAQDFQSLFPVEVFRYRYATTAVALLHLETLKYYSIEW